MIRTTFDFVFKRILIIPEKHLTPIPSSLSPLLILFIRHDDNLPSPRGRQRGSSERINTHLALQCLLYYNMESNVRGY